jgi:predicted HD superfamily hydrolase involved in NAD metabolism
MDLAEMISAADEYAARALSDKRYGHTRRVAETARELAKVHGVDPDRAYLAGLLHDIAREVGKDELLRLAGKWDIPVGEPERRQPTLLHAPVAAELALRELSVKDEEILDALRTHTTTAPGMSPLALVLYLADKVEPGRKYPAAARLREVARSPDLYEAARTTLRDQIQHTRSKGKEIHPASRAALEWLESGRS